MKRFIALISIIAVVLFTFSGITYAEDTDLKMTVRGSNVQFSSGKPFIENGRSLFPLRDLLVALGVKNDEQHIIWDGEKQSVTAILGDTKIELIVGKKEFYKNGQLSSMLDVAAESIGGRIYLPARVVAESFGFHIDYDAQAGTVLITEPSLNDNKAITNNDNKVVTNNDTKTVTNNDNKVVPNNDNKIVIENDIDVNSLVLINSKKSIEEFSDIELKSLNKIRAMNKPQLFELLVSQYDYKLPTAQTNLNIIKFIKQYFVTDLQMLVDYSLSASAEEKAYAVNQILNAMPDDLKITMLSIILEKHPIPNVRYNTAYIISKYNNEAAFNVLTKNMATEKNDSVFGNVVAGAMQIAGINADKILLLFNKYNDLTDSFKSNYNSMLSSITFGDKNIESAWKTFLHTKVNIGTDIDKKNANEILIASHVDNKRSFDPPKKP